MKRTGVIIGLVAILILAAIAFFWLREPEPRAPLTARVAPESNEPAGQVAPQPAETQDTVPADTGQGAAPESTTLEAPPQEAPPQSARVAPTLTPAPGPAPAPSMRKTTVKPRDEGAALPEGAASLILPTFDVVRVEPSGEAVIAGGAEPGSRVVLLDGGRPIAEVMAEASGQWVIVIETPLAPGDHELGLESHLASGEILLSENVVVVSVPPPAQVAAAPSATTQEPAPAAPAPASTSAGPVSPVPAAPAQATAEPGPEVGRPLAVLMPRSGEGPSRILQQPEPIPTGLGDGALVLETVDYDERGQAVIGGRGMAGVTLIIYLNGRPAGRAVVGPDGRWQVRLSAEVPYGVHLLRIDQVDAGGRVVARVESPFSRAVIVAGSAGETAVIVQPGNSLWRIARRIYGEGLRYSVIYQANQDHIRDPDLIYPGQIFVVPQSN